MIGTTILHYKILEKLGEGGMGIVYKAHDTKLEREVAIKFLPRQIATNAQERERFKIEAKAAAALNHPNIATIYAIEEADDDLFIVMEYIHGRELKEIVDTNPLSIENALNYSLQIVEGLQTAHEKGITHRDIKTANIMITSKGQVKIMDFGLAKVRGGAQVTKVGTTLGTAAYMSPEQARGEEADNRADIWSFGVVLYDMLTSQLPFGGDYEQAVIYAILNEEPQALSDLRHDVSETLQQLVDKTLTKDREMRYQNSSDLLSDLKAVCAGESRSRGPRSARIRFKPTPTQLSIVIGTIAVILLVFLATFLFNNSESNSVASEKSIAVLAFKDMSPAKDQEYFCDGMAEEIINALAQIPSLKVSARTSAFQFKERESDIQTIGKKLGVATVLKGNVRKSGNKLRVTAQLINVADGFYLWSQTYERKLADVFAIQDDLSRSIVQALQVKLSRDAKKLVNTRMPTNVDAYNLYLKGRYFWNRRTEQGLQKSVEFFQQAIDLEPTYALAYAGLADAYSILGSWQYLEPSDAFKKSRVAAHKALEIDETLAEAHAALGGTKFAYDWDWPGAEAEYKRAIELNPNYASVLSSSLDPISLDMKEAAKYIGISMRTLQRRMSKKHEIGKIRYINIGRRVLFPKFELDRWLKEEASNQWT
jgi:excisionase family DNA binding protein